MSSADSSGRLISKTEQVLIFDLDGTILSVNSFPYWVRAMLFGRFGGLSFFERLSLSVRTANIMLARKLLGKSHFITRQQLQVLWVEALKKDSEEMALYELHIVLQSNIRPNLKPLLQGVAGGKSTAVLATAAAGGYAESFGRALGFSHILTTGISGAENSRQEKCDRVLAFLTAQGFSLHRRIFLTDHEEDLPLIRESHRVLWFGKDEDVQKVRAGAPDTEIIPCRNLSDREIAALL